MLSPKILIRHPIIRLVLSYAAGASTSLAFAPYSFWPIYPIAMAWALWQTQSLSAKQASYYWLSFGLGCFSIGLSWVHVSMSTYGGIPLIVSISLMLLLAFYLALYPMLAGYLLAKLAPRCQYVRCLLLFPSLWVLTEWARGWVLTGFPWLWAGYSQTTGPIAPLASIVGALGLSYLVAMVAGALAMLLGSCSSKQLWKNKSLPIIIVVIVLLLGSYLSIRLSPLKATGKQVNVALVQGNIAQSLKWKPSTLVPTLRKYLKLSRPELDDTDLFIWPEAAIPAPEYVVNSFLESLNEIATFHNTAIITGIISQKKDKYYNSLIILGQYNNDHQTPQGYVDGNTNSYKKHHLLPIGEFVPFGSILRPLAPLFNLPMSSFTRGDYQQPNLTAKGHKLAPAICYEIAFPEQLRANVTDATEFLLTVSNDAWFGHSNGPLQHMEIARMRAIELGRPLLRATNNGVTAIVDEHGAIIGKIPQFKAGVLKASIPLVKGETLFFKWGQWPVLLLSVLILLISCARAGPQPQEKLTPTK